MGSPTTATKRPLGVNSLGKQIADQATREAARPTPSPLCSDEGRATYCREQCGVLRNPEQVVAVLLGGAAAVAYIFAR
jgi:hypothetical protein